MIFFEDIENIISEELNFPWNNKKVIWVHDIEDLNDVIPKLGFMKIGSVNGDDTIMYRGVDFTLEIFATDSGLDYNDPHMKVIVRKLKGDVE